MPRAKQAPEEQNDLIARIESYDHSYYISRDAGSEGYVGDEAIVEITARIERIAPKHKRFLHQTIEILFICARTFGTENDAGYGAKPVLFSVNLRKKECSLLAYMPADAFWTIPPMIENGSVSHVWATHGRSHYGSADLLSVLLASEAKVAKLDAFVGTAR